MTISKVSAVNALLINAIIAAPVFAGVAGVNNLAIEEVVVSSSGLGKTPLQMASPSVVLDHTAVQQRATNSIGATLTAIPGMSATAYGNGASRPIIRGLDGPRVRVLSDGLNMLDASDVSPDHAVTTEPMLAERVEILKGPATLLYGGGAIGGVVNVLDNKIPTQRPANGVSAAAESRFESVSNTEVNVLQSSFDAGPLVMHAEGVKRDGDNYDIPGDNLASGVSGESFKHTQPNSFNDTSATSFGTSLIGDPGFIGVAVTRQFGQYGLPAEPEEAPYIDLDQKRVDLRGELSIENQWLDSVRMRAADSDYIHRERTATEIATTFKNDAQEARIEAVHAPLAGWKGVVGVQGLWRDFSALGEEAYVPKTDTHNHGVFLLEEYTWQDWRFELGARNERQDITVESAQPDASHRGHSLSAGAVWDFVEGWSLHSSVSRSQRLPTAEELYADGPHAATATYEIGDDSLEDETANNIEVSLRKNSGITTFALTVYQNKIDDFIYAAYTGNVVDDFDEVIYTPANSTFTGAEAEIGFQLTEKTNLGFFADTVRGKLDDGGNLPRIPAARLGTTVNYSQNFSEGRSLYLDSKFYHVYKQNNAAEFETDTDGYNELSALAEYSLPVNKNFSATVFLKGENLLNKTERVSSSFIKDTVPLPGRNIIVGIRFNY